MAGIVVSASKGVIDSVLAKLDELIGDECAGLIGVSGDIRFLRDELPAMNALLENLEKVEDTQELNPLVKVWRHQVREMTYDTEDFIDNFMSNAESVDAKAGFMDKVSHFLQTWRARLETAWQIKDRKTRLQQINERCNKRYKYADCTSSTTYVVVDPRISAFYKEAASLVGIDGPKEELINQVMHDQGQQLKVVSIVEFGGLGKTMLANELFREVGGQFNCKAFVCLTKTRHNETIEQYIVTTCATYRFSCFRDGPHQLHQKTLAG
uniref:Rx N-terminal domain-containing protein n=1 Tax=Arundo donax TaxID=35708 RepID=A0A0A9FK93_ARUDO